MKTCNFSWNKSQDCIIYYSEWVCDLNVEYQIQIVISNKHIPDFVMFAEMHKNLCEK